MNAQENTIIGEMVAQNYRTATVFKKYNIDFCCQGNRTIKEACELKNIDSKAVIQDLDEALHAKSDTQTDYQSWPLDLLVDYIEKRHHRYVEEKIQEITPYLNKVCKVHGPYHPELLEIKEQFDASAAELTVHMKKEELILFPFIRKMLRTKQEHKQLDAPQFGTVQNPIHMMMEEHNTEGERFRRIEALSNQYTPPEDACNTYKVTYALLNEFEQDLHLHIHLENNILFPKAIRMEAELN
ncbi:MAG: iron-sulfur cluster repair di-iron protein [Sphingobacteriales bacterium]|jgi:regulator of cell morphogenesis and NO signaling|nr:MAG: iron-sulfur cluster repair di-iron protein [Sphingobacteriales bacterium]